MSSFDPSVFAFQDPPTGAPIPNFEFNYDFSFLDDFFPVNANDATAGLEFPQFSFPGGDGLGIDYSFLTEPVGAPQFTSPPASPAASFPRLPPVPASSPPAPVPEPFATDLLAARGGNPRKRKSPEEVDPANVITTTRPRKAPRRADA